MDVCYLLVYVQEIRIQPYFCVKQGDYFFPLFPKDPVFLFDFMGHFGLADEITNASVHIFNPSLYLIQL